MGGDDLNPEIKQLVEELRQARDLDAAIVARLEVVASELERNVDASVQLRKDVYDMLQKLELREQALNLDKRSVAERLAKIEVMLGIVERETTGAHRKHEESAPVAAIKAFGSLPAKALQTIVIVIPLITILVLLALAVWKWAGVE